MNAFSTVFSMMISERNGGGRKKEHLISCIPYAYVFLAGAFSLPFQKKVHNPQCFATESSVRCRILANVAYYYYIRGCGKKSFYHHQTQFLAHIFRTLDRLERGKKESVSKEYPKLIVRIFTRSLVLGMQ